MSNPLFWICCFLHLAIIIYMIVDFIHGNAKNKKELNHALGEIGVLIHRERGISHHGIELNDTDTR